MSPEWVAILALIALFVVGTVLPINMGALAFVAAWLVGMYSLNLDEKEIIAGISGDLVLTLVGVTYLFAIAKNNGTVDLIVRAAVRAVGGRVALIPWVMFGVTAVLTAIGAASPAACAIIGPIALGFAGRYKISPLMMGMFVVHGAQGGGFSPISIYGVITNTVMKENDLPVGEMTIFLSSLFFNLAIAIVLFFALGGRELMSRRIDADEPEIDTGHPAGGTAPAGSGHGGVATQTRGGATAVAEKVGVDQI
ncbi:MAG: SLC13 family permease, partial [Nocardioidaceae bacterium]